MTTRYSNGKPLNCENDNMTKPPEEFSFFPDTSEYAAINEEIQKMMEGFAHKIKKLSEAEEKAKAEDKEEDEDEFEDEDAFVEDDEEYAPLLSRIQHFYEFLQDIRRHSKHDDLTHVIVQLLDIYYYVFKSEVYKIPRDVPKCH